MPFRKLGLPVETTSAASELAGGLLSNLCKESISMIWFVRAGNPIGWLWLTLGWSKLPSFSKLRLWLVKPEDSNLGGLPKLSAVQTKRHSWLKTLQVSERFDGVCVVPSESADRLGKLLKEHEGASAWALYTDAKRTSVLIALYASGPMKASSVVKVCFDWSFGDPTRRVENLASWSASAWLADNSETSAASVVTAWIASASDAQYNFDEVFDR
jgi:hypothetical protein